MSLCCKCCMIWKAHTYLTAEPFLDSGSTLQGVLYLQSFALHFARPCATPRQLGGRGPLLCSYYCTYLLQGAEVFQRSWKVFSLVKKFPEFYRTRTCITASRRASHLSCPDPNRSGQCLPYPLLEVPFNIIFPSMPGSSRWLSSLVLLH